MTSTIDTLYRLTRAASWGQDREASREALRTISLPKRLPIDLTHLAIARRETFVAASMSARATDTDHQYRGGAGILPYDWASTFYSDTADGLAYVVYSYATPIGWERSDGLRVIPPVSYSVTTAQHQRKVREAWGMAWNVAYSHPTRSLATL